MKYSIDRRNFIKNAAVAGIGAAVSPSLLANNTVTLPTGHLSFLASARVGMIGLDTSHCEAFAKVLNDPGAGAEYSGFPVTIAYPYGSKDIVSSASRIPKITEDIKKLGIRIASSIEELISQSDVVLLETNDGRLHLEQALKVIKAKKRLFIDKPVAASVQDAVAIFEAAKKYNSPVFSSSSLRFAPDLQKVLNDPEIGKITGADAFSPCKIEETHPDLFWYGIHGVETLYTLMGTGCSQVTRSAQEGTDFVTGTWNDGRIGTFRGLRSGKADYGATAFGENGIRYISPNGGYEPLLKEIVQFFRSGKPPVSAEETIEICAFMEAADESKRQRGKPVSIASVMQKIKRISV